MGRRIGGWIIDLVIGLAIVGGILGMLAEYKEVPDNYDDSQEFCEDLLDANRDFEGNCIAPPGDRVYLVEYSDTYVYSGAALVWFVLNFVVLQGLTGGTVGKLITGVRVVDGQGANAGVGRCLGRSLMWIVDGLPGVPLVGGIAALTSNGHRRVGDMVAGTFVVGTASVGRPVDTPAVAAPAGAPAWGSAPQSQPQAWQHQPTAPQPTWQQPQPTWEQPPAQQPTWAPPSAPADEPTQGYGASGGEPTQEPAPTEPLGIGAEPEPGPDPELGPEPQSTPAAPAPEADPVAPEADPVIETDDEPTTVVDEEPPSDDEPPPFDPTATVAGAHAPWSTTAPAPAEPVAPEAPAAEPQWDEARGTYIQWDAAANTWLQWDSASNSWVPIS